MGGPTREARVCVCMCVWGVGGGGGISESVHNDILCISTYTHHPHLYQHDWYGSLLCSVAMWLLCNTGN